MPSATILALSATLPPLVLAEVQSLLGLSQDVTLIRRSNDRSNISLLVRRMLYPVSSLQDLAFLVPHGFTLSSPPPPKFMLFMESKVLCQHAATFLR
jgi:superfamily II DNA helicase RecQ